MKLRNCPFCGRVFVDNASGMCPDCYADEQEAEYKVGEYLRKVSKASVEDIHTATGVKESIILRMLRQGRLFGDFEVSYPCEHCGTPIVRGRLCDKCSSGILDQLMPPEPEQATDGETERQKGRMYTQGFRKR